MNKEYNVCLFSEIPHNLKNDIIDLKKEKVDITDKDLSPHARIIIETSKDLKAIPYLIRPEQTFFDFFCLKAKEAGITPQEISDRLAKQFPE